MCVIKYNVWNSQRSDKKRNRKKDDCEEYLIFSTLQISCFVYSCVFDFWGESHRFLRLVLCSVVFSPLTSSEVSHSPVSGEPCADDMDGQRCELPQCPWEDSCFYLLEFIGGVCCLCGPSCFSGFLLDPPSFLLSYCFLVWLVIQVSVCQEMHQDCLFKLLFWFLMCWGSWNFYLLVLFVLGFWTLNRLEA